MAGDFVSETDPAYKSQLQGRNFYFNSYTKRGKLNYIFATWGFMGACYLLFKSTRGKKPEM